MRVTKFRLELVKESNKNYDELEHKKASSPYDVYEIANAVFRLDYQTEEIFGILTLDTKNNVSGAFEVSRGSVNSSIVHPREVFKRAILQNASSIVLVHNHPSGEIEPSHEDILLTNRLVEAGNILGVRILDHIITGDKRYYSFKEEGMI